MLDTLCEEASEIFLCRYLKFVKYLCYDSREKIQVCHVPVYACAYMDAIDFKNR